MIHSITLTNFKSYFGTTRIPFPDRLMSIIGPNGCGKSNILDSISFILLYNSKEMRVTKNEDFISLGCDECNVCIEFILPKNNYNDNNNPNLNNLYEEVELKNNEDKENNNKDKNKFIKLILERSVNKKGRSTYIVNKNTVSLSQYREILHLYTLIPSFFIVLQDDLVKLTHSENLTPFISSISSVLQINELKNKKIEEYIEKEYKQKNNYTKKALNNIEIDNEFDFTNTQCSFIDLKKLYSDTEKEYNISNSVYKDLFTQKSILNGNIKHARENIILNSKIKKLLKDKNEIQKCIILSEIQENENILRKESDVISVLEKEKSKISLSKNLNNIKNKDFYHKFVFKGTDNLGCTENFIDHLSNIKNELVVKQHKIIINEKEIEKLHEILKKKIKNNIEHNLIENKQKNNDIEIERLENELKDKNKLINECKKEILNIEEAYKKILISQNNHEISNIDGKNIHNEENFCKLESEYLKMTVEQQSNLISLTMSVKPSQEKIKILENNLKKVKNQIKQFKNEINDINMKKEQINSEIYVNNQIIEAFNQKINLTKQKNNENPQINNIKNGDEILFQKHFSGLTFKTQDYINYITLKKQEKNLNNSLTKLLTQIEETKHYSNTKKEELNHLKNISDLQKIFTKNQVHGRLYDLISIPQNKHKTAITTLLGKFKDSVIVENENVALKCVEYLKKNRKGYMTFVPRNILNRFKGNLQNNYTDFREISYAVEVIQYDSLYKNVIDYVFKNSLVCESIDVAKKIKFLGKFKCDEKICVYDGTVFHRNNTITGGKFNNLDLKYASTKNINKNEEENEYLFDSINNLLKKKHEILDKLREIHFKKTSFANIEMVIEKIEDLKLNIRKLKENLVEETNKMQNIQENIEKQNNYCVNIENLLLITKKEIENTEDQIIKIKQHLSSVIKKIFQNKTFEIRNKICLIKEYDDLQSALEIKNSSVNLLAEKENEYEKVKSTIDRKIRVLGVEIEKIMADIQVKKNEKANLDKINVDKRSNDEIKLEIENRYKDISEMRKEYLEMKKYYDDNKIELETVNKKIIQIDSDILNKKAGIEELNEKIDKLIKRMDLEGLDIPFIEENENKDFNIQEEDLDAENDKKSFKRDKKRLNIDFSILKYSFSEYIQKLNEISREIDSLTEKSDSKSFKINTISKSYEKISFEYEVARKKMINLKEVLNEIKNLRTERFLSCIKKINQTLEQTYKEITKNNLNSNFNNNENNNDNSSDISLHLKSEINENINIKNNTYTNAYLIPENTMYPFESKTKYYIMPPNKRYREIHNLSGGERAMAIFALVFAINEYRKAPFFVFDEMDSALDKENYRNVVSFIKDQIRVYGKKKNLQVIVITLKLGVFCEADSLVGVYKVKGKSNVLTYKLNDN